MPHRCNQALPAGSGQREYALRPRREPAGFPPAAAFGPRLRHKDVPLSPVFHNSARTRRFSAPETLHVPAFLPAEERPGPATCRSGNRKPVSDSRDFRPQILPGYAPGRRTDNPVLSVPAEGADGGTGHRLSEEGPSAPSDRLVRLFPGCPRARNHGLRCTLFRLPALPPDVRLRCV